MSFNFRPASMDGGVGLLIGIAGVSGAGKSFSAMQIAAGIVGPGNRFAVIDTEAGRALHYSKLFAFDHCELEPPFRPERYLEAIRAAEAAGYKAIVIDSWSHCWSGEGGMHDWAEDEMIRLIKSDNDRQAKYGKPPNDEMFLREKLNSASWQDPKIRYKADMGRLIRSKAHLIFCMRAEDKLIIEQRVDDKTGRKKTVYIPGADRPLKDRYIPICCHNPEFMYELTVSFVVTPENPGVPVPIKLQEQHRHAFPEGRTVTKETGRLLAEWARGGGPTNEPAKSNAPEQIDIEALKRNAEAAANLGGASLDKFILTLTKAEKTALGAFGADLRATARKIDETAAQPSGTQTTGQSDDYPKYMLSVTATEAKSFDGEGEYLRAYEAASANAYRVGALFVMGFDERNKPLIGMHDGLAETVAQINERVRR